MSEGEPVALVTGAARRLGAAIARTLHADGMRIALHYRDSVHDAQALVADLRSVRPGTAREHRADLLEPGAPERLVAEVVETHGRLDLLVNNASTFRPTPVGEFTEAHWRDLVGTNLEAPLFLAQAAAPHLARTEGCIVNLLDVHASRPLARHSLYASAKAGLAMATRVLALDLAPRVRVNGVAPGAILWPEPEPDEAHKHAVLDTIPLGRLGALEEVARAVLYLARDARYTTGSVLAVDGGRELVS